jgi:glutathione S-transferase
MTDQPVLYQLRFSHFNEKARWALDYKRVPHVRRSSLPVTHVIRAMRLTRAQTMPILSIDGKAISDSSKIIERLESDHPEPPLYPADPAERERALELQRYFGDEVGAELRRVFFFYMLRDEPEALRDMYTRPFGRVEGGSYRAAFPLMKVSMRKAMAVNEEETEWSLRQSLAGLDRLEAELDGREYLAGDAFSVADLTVASLYYPMVRPLEYQYLYPEPWGTGLDEIRSTLADRPGFAWIAEMWRRHRGSSAEVKP